LWGEGLEEIDVAEHVLVPKHIILSEEEKNEVLKKYRVSLKQLPRIIITDPAIKNMNPKIGDVVKIVRESRTAKEIVFYRVVVRG
jgi:DNA-directed RNA polymerase subunit H